MRRFLNQKNKKFQITIMNILNPPMLGPGNFLIGIFAVMVSWALNKSVLWAIFHWIFGWIYLFYILLIGGFKDGGFMEIMNNYF